MKRRTVLWAAALAAALSLLPSALSAEQVTLKFACWDYDLYPHDKALIQAFQQDNPDIKVEVISVPNADYDNKMNIMLSGGEDLDVLYVKSVALFGSLSAKNLLADIKPLIQKDKLDLTPYGAFIDYYLTRDNAILGLPYRSDRYLLYYNKDIFDAAKEPYPSPNMTWADMRALAKKLTKGTGKDKIWGAFFAPANYCFLTPGLQEGKGGYLDMDFNLFRDGWSNFYAMMFEDKTAQDWATLKSVSADQTYFIKGNSAMMMNGTWFMNLIATEIANGRTSMRWGAVRAPVSSAMKAAGKVASNGSITPVAMTKKTTKTDAAWKLVKFLSSEKAAKILASYLIVPGYNIPAVVDVMAKVKGFDTTAKDAINSSGAAYPPLSGANPIAGALSSMVNKQLELLFTQNQDLDKTFSEMARLRKEIIDQNK
jgi:multiple sugar transport system substrate-binding protein